MKKMEKMDNRIRFFFALAGIGVMVAFYVISEERAKEMIERKKDKEEESIF